MLPSVQDQVLQPSKCNNPMCLALGRICGGALEACTKDLTKQKAVLLTKNKNEVKGLLMPFHLQFSPKIESWLSHKNLKEERIPLPYPIIAFKNHKGVHRLVFHCAQEQLQFLRHFALTKRFLLLITGGRVR